MTHIIGALNFVLMIIGIFINWETNRWWSLICIASFLLSVIVACFEVERENGGELQERQILEELKQLKEGKDE